MTTPNALTKTDLLEIRERMKRWLTPAFARAVDRGELDGWGLFRRAEAELIRERTQQETGE